MNLTRLPTSASRPVFKSTIKAVSSHRPTTVSRTIMGALNGQKNVVVSKQNGARSGLIPVANRLGEGRALAQDVWSVFKCVLT
ncbi:uncharacterized protein PHACADRAFT_157746 [Phanerochaete carnosa HHB-10118-sp]|uniref:Uncharacterized protein n=1 Tax=Phanerochaete carnosa (strain HHB-10118-sp) TaxID=650164 RepID=K5WJ44_PHACS|nr:uncharacterized protein PHACADRAFT_157746 [Phanerochaete carnosa HHB-10118-sp]EKM59390.1 hypothetical protein PHACADRAFT_157746 [Phanerochaete carnosa HHB-10118-sp]